jgi:hypothetical protein
MVNGWLRLRFAGTDIGKTSAFRHGTALTSSSSRGMRRSEVVLARAILGLLINRTAALAAGN